MIVYQNNLITLHYEPATDVLLVEWPSSEPYSDLEILQTLQKMVEVVQGYAVKNLLINASKADINMSDDEYRVIISKLGEELSNTPLKKIARVMTSDPIREEKIYTIRKKVVFPFEFEDFKTREEAYSWLTDQ